MTEGDPQLSYTTSENCDFDRSALFEEHLSWAAAIAKNVHRKLPPSFDIDDLTQEAHIALWRRCQLYDPQNERGVPFQGYAYVYVRGACLMHCRRRNWREATHLGLGSSGEADHPTTLNIKGASDGMERWSIGRKGTIARTAADRRATPEQVLQLRQEEEIEHDRLVRFFSAIPPPVPAGIVLVRIICVEGEDLEALARKRGISTKYLVRKLNSGVRQLRKLQSDGFLKEIGGIPDLGIAHVN
jgi:RNA polymerase sigma factor (sigma-70 family)